MDTGLGTSTLYNALCVDIVSDACYYIRDHYCNKRSFIEIDFRFLADLGTDRRFVRFETDCWLRKLI
jgi:hypothetical protein